MVYVSKYDEEQGKRIDIEPTKEYIVDRIKEWGSIDFTGFQTDEQVKEFISKFPKYVNLQLKYLSNAESKTDKRYIPACNFSINSIDGRAGEINEAGIKRTKRLLKGLGL